MDVVHATSWVSWSSNITCFTWLICVVSDVVKACSFTHYIKLFNVNCGMVLIIMPFDVVTICSSIFADTVYFHVPSRTEKDSTVYGVSCYRQIDSKVHTAMTFSQH